MSDDFLSIQLKKAEKWDELCDSLKWGRCTPVETLLLTFHATNKGNIEKRQKLEEIREILEEPQYMDEAVILKYKLLKVINNE